MTTLIVQLLPFKECLIQLNNFYSFMSIYNSIIIYIIRKEQIMPGRELLLLSLFIAYTFFFRFFCSNNLNTSFLNIRLLGHNKKIESPQLPISPKSGYY